MFSLHVEFIHTRDWDPVYVYSGKQDGTDSQTADPHSVKIQYCSCSIHLSVTSFITLRNNIVMHTTSSSPKCTQSVP